MQQHLNMIAQTSKLDFKLFFQVISEESDIRPISFKLIDNVNSKNDEVDKLIKNDMSVPFNKVTVWVDPLDATQEYKGKISDL